MRQLSDEDRVAMAARNGVSTVQIIAVYGVVLFWFCVLLCLRFIDPRVFVDMSSGVENFIAVSCMIIFVAAREAMFRRRLIDPLLRENTRLNRELRDLRTQVESMKQ